MNIRARHIMISEITMRAVNGHTAGNAVMVRSCVNGCHFCQDRPLNGKCIQYFQYLRACHYSQSSQGLQIFRKLHACVV